MTLRSGKERLYKPCADCGRYFQPTGRMNRFCDHCIWKRKNGQPMFKKKRRSSKKIE